MCKPAKYPLTLMASNIKHNVVNFDHYRHTSNISHTLLGNKSVDHSDVVVASPVGVAPTASSFSTSHQASVDGQRQLQNDARNIWVLGFGATYMRGLKTTCPKNPTNISLLSSSFRQINAVCAITVAWWVIPQRMSTIRSWTPRDAHKVWILGQWRFVNSSRSSSKPLNGDDIKMRHTPGVLNSTSSVFPSVSSTSPTFWKLFKLYMNQLGKVCLI